MNSSRTTSFSRQRLWLVLALTAGVLIGAVFATAAPDASKTDLEPATAAAGIRDARPATAPGPGLDVAQALSDAFQHAADTVAPSVVAIYAEQDARRPAGMAPDGRLPDFFGEDFFRRFFGERPGPRGQALRGVGSGVIVSADGYILTNNHVVAGADELEVVLDDDRRLEAELIGTDPETDVAVIKVDAENLPVAELGDSESLRVGQWVIAVGNPFQLMHTVTAGIVSAQGRDAVGLAAYENFIQTDASINPGNSGGALADLSGRVVGINTAISSPSGGNVGIGFAIPIDMARRVMDDLIADGEVSRGFLALMPQDLDEDLAAAMGLASTAGALVADVTKDGPADRAGIERGDVIVGFAGRPVEDSRDLRNKVADVDPGKKVEVELVRDGKTRTVDVKLGERPRPAGATNGRAAETQDTAARLGVEVQTLTPELASRLGTDHTEGVVVTGVEPGGAADDAGLRRGDVILEVDRKPVKDARALGDAVRAKDKGERLLLLVARGDATFYAAVRLG